jgi:hypothetical protein
MANFMARTENPGRLSLSRIIQAVINMTKGEILSRVVRHGMDKYLNPDTALMIYNQAQTKLYDKAIKSGLYKTTDSISEIGGLDEKAGKLAERYISIYHKHFPDYWVNKHY